jgi:hypothetical protein
VKKLRKRYGRAFIDRHGRSHEGHPLDVLIVKTKGGFFVRRRDPNKIGVQFDSHSEAAHRDAVLWANGIAMGRPVHDESGGGR